MAKERTMNEIRQTKEYYTGNNTARQTDFLVIMENNVH